MLAGTVATLAPNSPPGGASAGSSNALAFPGAVGYGRETVGGRGGRIVYVTSLADSGPGTLRAALETSGPRTVVFRVAGTIDLRSDIAISDPYVTVAGQSAPGGGIVLRGATLHVRTSQVILRHLRLRPGDAVTDSPAEQDGLTVNGGTGAGIHHVVVDHVEALWGPDIGGLALLNAVRDVTVQNSIFGEGLYLSRHPEAVESQGGHSLGANVANVSGATPYPERITLVRNLFTTSEARMPQLQGVQCADVVNNVVYNFGTDAAHGNPRAANIVNNWFRKGPETATTHIWRTRTSRDNPSVFTNSVYLAGNVADGFSASVSAAAGSLAGTPRCPFSVTPAPASLDAVLADVGATRPARDTVTTRILRAVVDRTGQYFNGVGEPAPNPYWPTVAAGTPFADVDADGMADTWEIANFGSLARGSASDSSGDYDGDGYTDVEEYLNGTDPRSGTGGTAPATTPTPTPTPSPTPSAAPTPTPSPTPSAAPTPTPSPTPSPDPTRNRSPEATPAEPSDAPVVSEPRARLAPGTGGPGIPVRISWSAIDDGTGVRRFLLAESVDGGGYETVGLPSPEATKVTRALAPGREYRYRVRLVDDSGAVSDWAYGRAFRLLRYEETSDAIEYRGDWRSAEHDSYFGGAVAYTQHRNARAAFTFVGTGVALIGPVGPTRGEFGVYVDGELAATVDLYATSFRPVNVLFSRTFTDGDRHTVEIVAAGTPGRPTVAIDAFHVLE
ncbi:MAG TPA: hypothetical protein VNJ28_00620 [Candidatus Limnocylindrales bacterium]|nr:hypothetical protein [Candidatus Limnocylindrales bacterium]